MEVHQPVVAVVNQLTQLSQLMSINEMECKLTNH